MWDECKEAGRDQTMQRLLDHAKEFCSHFFSRIRGSHWRTLIRSSCKDEERCRDSFSSEKGWKANTVGMDATWAKGT